MKKRFLIIIVFILLVSIIINKRYNTKSCTFTRTYFIEKLTKEDDNYYYVTLKQYQYDDRYNLKLDKNLYDDIKENYNYEFLLEKTNHKKVNSIKDIFKNTKIISITKTDNIGLSQKQEKICK